MSLGGDDQMSVDSTCGITWLREIVACLDGPHAAFVAYPEFPIIYAPPRHAGSLLDMPGLYHELGHIAFHYERDIGRVLGAVVSNHFDQLRHQAGVITPAKRAERDRELNAAQMYWNESRLDEIFCDVFATYVVGPAHYASFVDLALRTNSNPFVVPGGAHPPLALRVRACYEALLLPQREEPLVVMLRDAWRAHERSHGRNHFYSLACDDRLVDSLRNESIQCITTYLPAAIQYAGTPSTAIGEPIGAAESLEQILNVAAATLFLAPDRYVEWEVRALMCCHNIASMR